MTHDDSGIYLGRIKARSDHREFRILDPDRLFHLYVIGQTGVGKTTLLESLILQDIHARRGCALIDPHGDLAQRILAMTPEHRKASVVYIDIADPTSMIGYNPLTRISEARRPLVASGLLSVMKKMWEDSWGPRMEHILRNTLLALLDQPKATLPDALSMYSDKTFRKAAIRNIRNAQVRAFWSKEFPAYSERFIADSIAPIQNKIGAFLADPRLRRFVCPEGEGLRLRQIMDESKVLIVNLSKGMVGEDSASILGGLLVTAIGLAGLSRADIPEYERRPFYLYLDEFQNVTTLAMAEMLSELRKYRLSFVMAHQYLAQLAPEIRHAVLGNAGTIISFRVGAEDARALARQFEPRFESLDLISLPNRYIYVRLMIDGAPSPPFSAVTIAPEEALMLQEERRRVA